MSSPRPTISNKLADALELAVNFLDSHEFIGEALDEARAIIDDGNMALAEYERGILKRICAKTKKRRDA